jgi:uncharacterized membrane protein YdjX (TVP38/TMEM64 family)
VTSEDAVGIARTGAFGLLLVYATAMPLLAGGLVLWALPVVDAQLRAAGLLGLPLFAALGGGALAMALLPATLLAALAGAAFGLAGLGPAVVAYAVASVLVFEVVRRWLRVPVQRAIARSPRARAAQEELARATFRVVTLSRLSPVLPFALVNVLLAVSPVSRPVYLAGTLVGMLPRTAAAVVAGAATRSALAAMGEGTGDAGPLGRTALVLAVAATVGLAWYVVRAIRRAMAR